MPHPPNRRRFLHGALLASGGALAQAAPPPAHHESPPGLIGLDGDWLFRLDPGNSGEAEHWFQPGSPSLWRTVHVPHTWQIEPEHAGYRGVAWYRRTFSAPPSWASHCVRIEFEAVFHTATVWLNGVEIGRHVGKGYTAFTLDAGRALRPGAENTIAVRVDNDFNSNMLPRGRSSDWAHDGGIYRPVHLLVTPPRFVEALAIDASPDLASRRATVHAVVTLRNTSPSAWSGELLCSVAEDPGATVLHRLDPVRVSLAPGERKEVALPPIAVPEARLWNFDHPHLYLFTAALSSGHAEQSTFGIRQVETRDGAFFVNGERVRLMGVERMAGSNPVFGMAEPLEWIEHDHADMKALNCVYTRVHWPQDRRVLDWCDRHGIFIQTEVPTWGSATFDGMTSEPSAAIMSNGLEQLREMIARDRNHPCLFSWGVCNEIGGQNPPAYAFARRMYQESKRLDPKRLVSYASHSLYTTPEKDVSGLMNYVMCNEYFESWHPGTPADVLKNIDNIHRAFPDKAIVISEYGYCACTADRPEGDQARIRILETHDQVFRSRPFIAGLIFFCYNDYRTHVGDRGTGVLKQRVHGVVDILGARKPSWEALRMQSSPIEACSVTGKGTPPHLTVSLTTRATVPSYPLRGYRVRAFAFGSGRIPEEEVFAPLPDLQPGASASVSLAFSLAQPQFIALDVLSLTGFSVASAQWRY